MALIILNQTRCPLCNEVIAEGDAYIATTAFVHDPADPLWPYSDAAIHTACFQSWPHRPDFVAAYNAAAARANLPNRMTPEGRLRAQTMTTPADIASKMLDTLRPDLARNTPPITDYHLIPAPDHAPRGLSITLICDDERDLPALKRQLPTWAKALRTHLIAQGFDADDASTCECSATSRDYITRDGGAFNHFR